MTVLADPSGRLRAILSADRPTVAPGAVDPLTARIIEGLGFDAVYLGGNAMGSHIGVGQPFISLTETIDIARNVIRAVEVPVIVDIGTGFGDPPHIHRTISECEYAHIAAVQIDDQPYPKRAAYHRGLGEVVSLDEAAARLVAATAARKDHDLVLIARTDVYRVTRSLEAAAQRCRAFAAAGADVVMVLDLDTAQAADLAEHLPRGALLGWIGGATNSGPSLKELADAGIRLAVFPFNTLAAIVQAVADTWSVLRDQGRLQQSPEMLAEARERLIDLTGLRAYWAIEDCAFRTDEGTGRT